MSTYPQVSRSSPNRLLPRLPANDYQRLLPDLETVAIRPGQVLVTHGPGRKIYFLGGASAQSPEGRPRGRSQAFAEMLMQSVACNALHSIEMRCARCLLEIRDRIGRNEFLLTQNVLATMLGVRRASITLAAGALHRAGLIDTLIRASSFVMPPDWKPPLASVTRSSGATSSARWRETSRPIAVFVRLTYGFVRIPTRNRVNVAAYPSVVGTISIHQATMAEAVNARPASGQNVPPTDEDIFVRVQAEFLEMPGLRLTEAQARRLWGLDATTCSALLNALIDARFLFRTREGSFMRMDHAVPLKAGLPPRATAITAA